MNKDQKAKLERAFRNERFKKYTVVIAACSVFLVIGLLFLYMSLPQEINETQNITGTTVKVTATPSQFGNNTAMLVKLENGKNISLPITGSMVFKPNSKVNLKMSTTTSGKQLYQFINYEQ